MPGRDHKGPEGEGPMTGRKLGDCGDGAKQPLTTRPGFWGRGFRRWGNGRRGMGFGRGRGWRFWNQPDTNKKEE